MITTLSLRYFEEAVNAGSVRAAADRLHVAASAVGRQITLLEEQLGVPILERGRGRTPPRITAAGELLLHYIRKTNIELNHVRSEIEALKGLRKGHIRFGIPETLVSSVVPDIMMRFNQCYPGITYTVQVQGSPKLVELISSDLLDLAVTFNPPKSANVKHLFELQLPTCVLMASDHPLADRKFLKLSDCTDYGLAMPDETISSKFVYDEMLTKARIRPREIIRTNSYELLHAVAKVGLAITFVNAKLGEAAVGPGYRYVPFKDARVKPQRVTICTFDARNPSPVVAVFIEQMKIELNNLGFV